MTSLTSRPKRLAAVIALVVLVAIAVGAYIVWNSAQKSTAANEGGALAEFRAKDIADTAPPSKPASDGSVPAKKRNWAGTLPSDCCWAAEKHGVG